MFYFERRFYLVSSIKNFAFEHLYNKGENYPLNIDLNHFNNTMFTSDFIHFKRFLKK